MTNETTPIAALIKALIDDSLPYEHLEIINESHKHKGHAGDDGSGDTHFKLIVVSGEFSQYTRMQRHRMVQSILGPAYSKGLHALSMMLRSPEEVA